MPRRAVAGTYAGTRRSVPVAGNITALRTSRALGGGRLAVGAAFLAAPVPSLRVLGVDSGTAARMTFLARMAAVRDLVLGAGTVAAGRGAAPWVLAGAVADAVDAVVIGAAVRQRRLGAVPALGIAAGAAGAAVLGMGAARTLHRG